MATEFTRRRRRQDLAARRIEDTQHIARVWIDRAPDHVLIAALGHAYGPNPDRGIFAPPMAARPGRKFFTRRQVGRNRSGGDPHNSNVMFAALYQIQRTPWSLESGGPGSGLYRSTTVEIPGSTWSERPAGGHSGAHRVSVSGPTRIVCTRSSSRSRAGCIVR